MNNIEYYMKTAVLLIYKTIKTCCSYVLYYQRKAVLNQIFYHKSHAILTTAVDGKPMCLCLIRLVPNQAGTLQKILLSNLDFQARASPEKHLGLMSNGRSKR